MTRGSFEEITPAGALCSAVLLAAALASACSRASGAPAALPPAEAAQPTVSVRLATPVAHLEGDTARATGELRSRLQATLTAKVPGTLVKVYVQPGARVRKGDALVELDPATLLIQLEQARAARKMALAARENARSDLSRTMQLFEAGSAPRAILDRVSAGAAQADAAHEQADAQVRLLEQNLRDHVVRAPFDGVVTSRARNVGDFVAPPAPVATLVAVDALEVRLSVPEGLVDSLRPGATLRGRAIPGGAPFEGKVTSVGAIVDAATRAVEVIAEVRAPTSGAGGPLRSGGLAEVDLGATVAGEGPFVPARAVGRDGEKRFVWVVEGGAARRREVQVEAVSPQWYRVRTGLARGEGLVVEGGSGLSDGMRVAVAG